MLVDKYYTPGSIDEALENMALPGLVKALAGGTDMNISLHEREIRPDVIVDLTHVDELRKIHFEDGIVHVGSTATFHEIEEDPIVLEHIPMLAAAASTVGSPQIRALGTAGGNLCNAATAADTVPAMMAMDAEAVIRSKRGERRLPVTQIPTGLNKTCLESDELLIEFLIKPTTGKFVDFEKIGRRKALAISRINMAMVLTMEEKTIRTAAVAYGAVGKTAYRMQSIEEFLQGRTVTEETISEARDVVERTIVEVLAGRSTTPYKKQIGAAVMERALRKVLEG